MPKTKKMSVQQLRNLTTRRLHTEMGDIYKDLEFITGMDGLMTHMLPRVMQSVDPWLKKQGLDSRFWDGKHDPSHEGEEVDIKQMDKEEVKSMLKIYTLLPNPLAG